MKRCLALLLLSLGTGACVQSVNPLSTDATAVPLPALIGSWVGESGDMLVIAAHDSTTYALAMLDQDGKVSQWIGRVTELGDERWLDVTPAELPEQWSDGYRSAFLPLHTFWMVRRVDSVLVTAGLKYDSLRAALRRDPAVVAHAVVDDGYVLTASTPELRAFVTAFAARPGTLDDGDVMRRVSRPR